MGPLPVQRLWAISISAATTAAGSGEREHTFCMLVAERTLSHVSQLDGSLGAGIHEPVTAHGVEFSCCDDLGELLHVGRLDVYNVETLVLNVEIPQVYAKIVAADECFAVTVY